MGCLRRHGVDPESVADIIAKTHPNRLIVDIVSSQLDADRMDYLLRDSLMTGVEYGVYDAEWLLNAMCVGRDPGADTEDRPEQAWRLCLDRERGLYAAEQLILARHHMMLQVYMHRVTRGYEVMLLNLFQHAARLASEGSLPARTPEVIGVYFNQGIRMPLNDWMVFDETAMVGAIQAWSRSTAAEHAWLGRMSSGFLERARFYQGFGIGHLPLNVVMVIPEELSKAGLKKDLDWGLDNGEHLPYKGVLYGAARGAAEDEEQSTLSILLSDGDPAKKGQAIEGRSNILEGLDNDLQPLTRLYVDRSRLGAAEPVLRRLKVMDGGQS